MNKYLTFSMLSREFLRLLISELGEKASIGVCQLFDLIEFTQVSIDIPFKEKNFEMSIDEFSDTLLKPMAKDMARRIKKTGKRFIFAEYPMPKGQEILSVNRSTDMNTHVSARLLYFHYKKEEYRLRADIAFVSLAKAAEKRLG